MDHGPSSAPPSGRPYRADHGNFPPPSYTGYPPVGSPEPYRDSSDSSSQLLGPGMPGSDLTVGISQRGRGMRHVSSVPSAISPSYLPYSQFSRSPPTLPVPLPRPTSSHVSPDHDFSRTLPPLAFGSAPSQGSFPASLHHAIHPISPFTRSTPVTPSTFRFQLSPSPPPTHPQNPPEQSASSSSSSFNIPPPFTLQPQPQWDSSTFSSRQSSWSRSESRQANSPSPPTAHGDSDAVHVASPTHEDTTPRLEHAPPPRSGRYDPVRAMFVPYTPPGEMHPPSSPTDDKP